MTLHPSSWHHNSVHNAYVLHHSLLILFANHTICYYNIWTIQTPFSWNRAWPFEIERGSSRRAHCIQQLLLRPPPVHFHSFFPGVWCKHARIYGCGIANTSSLYDTRETTLLYGLCILCIKHGFCILRSIYLLYPVHNPFTNIAYLLHKSVPITFSVSFSVFVYSISLYYLMCPPVLPPYLLFCWRNGTSKKGSDFICPEY